MVICAKRCISGPVQVGPTSTMSLYIIVLFDRIIDFGLNSTHSWESSLCVEADESLDLKLNDCCDLVGRLHSGAVKVALCHCMNTLIDNNERIGGT